MRCRMTVDAEAFSDAMRKVSRVLVKKCSIPILEEICVQVRSGRCTLAGTDLDTWMTVEIPAEGDDLAFVFRRTRDVMRAFALFQGELTIDVEELPDKGREQCRLTACCGHRTAEYEATTDADYPNHVLVETDCPIELEARKLLERIERVRYAALRPNFATRAVNTCVQCVGNQVFSLDGYRAACDKDETVRFPVPFLAYGNALNNLKVFGDNTITLQVGDHYVKFTGGGVSLFIRKQESTPFDMDSAVPKQFVEYITVNTQVLLRELDYLNKCAAGSAKPYVRFAGEELSLSIPGGNFQTSVPMNGRGNIVLGFNLPYMLDAVRQFRNAENITIKLGGTYAPLVIEAEGRSDYAMVLPVRMRAQVAA